MSHEGAQTEAAMRGDEWYKQMRGREWQAKRMEHAEAKLAFEQMVIARRLADERSR